MSKMRIISQKTFIQPSGIRIQLRKLAPMDSMPLFTLERLVEGELQGWAYGDSAQISKLTAEWEEFERKVGSKEE